MRLYALRESARFAAGIADRLGVELEPIETRAFHDGERKIRPLSDPAGADAYVVQSLHGGLEHRAHERICSLLFFMATLRDHGARRVTAVTPFLAYARKDRRTKPFDPLTLRYLAELMETAGADRVLALEPHDRAAFENAFRVPTRIVALGDVLATAEDSALARWLAGPGGPLVVASPDPGGVKRAQLLRESLEARLGAAIGSALVEKRRSGGALAFGASAGGVEGARVLIADDLIESGATLAEAARRFDDAGAAEIRALAAHGLFKSGPSPLSTAPIRAVAVSDAADAQVGTELNGGLEVLRAAPAFAAAISAMAAA